MGTFTQMIDNLPDEILSQKRFFKVGRDKVPLVTAWSNPDNQQRYNEVEGIAGFDISGHDLAPDYLVVDFDHIFDDNGNFVNADAQKWFEFCVAAKSFSELSISKTGAHFVFKPTPNKFSPTANGKSGVLQLGDGAKAELFYKTKGRYFLLTGDVYQCPAKAPVVAGDAADAVFQALLDEIADRLQKSSPARQSIISKSEKILQAAQIDSPDYDLFRAERMLNDINPADLNDTDWLAVMTAAKNIGVSYAVVDSFNQRDPNRYKETENQRRWDSLDDTNFGIETLHGIAKRFHYSEKDSMREWFQLHPELSAPKISPHREEKISPCNQTVSSTKYKEIVEWEKVNGVINSEILADLVSFADTIKNVKDFAAVAADTSTIKKLGYCRFYPFAHVEQKFFVDLRAAVDKAKSKVKAWGKHIKDTDKYNSANIGAKRELDLSKKPADADFTLATINPRLVSEETNKYAKKAKREHEKWLVQHKCDELNAKRQAEHEDYEEAPPTTKQTVPDCPIDLILPEGATFTANGIKYVDWDKPAKDGRPRVEICHNPIVPTKKFLNVETGAVSYEVALKCGDRWVSNIFDARTLTEPRSVFALANCGLKIAEPRLLAKFISKLLSINENNHRLQNQRIFSRPGWHEVDGEGKIFLDPRRLPDGVQIDDGELARHLKTKGTLDEWKRAYDLAKASPIARATVAAAFVPLILDIIGERNFMLYLKGVSRAGKTTCLLAAASAVGDLGLARSLDATKNGLGALAAEFSDYPLILDEKQAHDTKQADLNQLLYVITNGMGRTRSSKDGKVRSADSWRTVVIGTGEVDLIDDTATEGSYTRLLTLPTPPKILPDDDSRTIREILPDNHGLALPLFLDKIKKELTHETIKAEYRDLVNALKPESPNLLDEHRRYVAAITTADGILNHALGADFDEAKADALENLVMKLFPIIPTACELSLFDRYKEFVLGIVGKNQGRFKKGVGYDAIKPPQETWGIIRDDDGYTHILADVFKEQCERAKLDYRKVESVLVEGKFFIPDKKIEEGHKTPRKTKRKLIGKVRLYCYRFRNEELGDE